MLTRFRAVLLCGGTLLIKVPLADAGLEVSKSLGEVFEERAPHPEPRVIVNVLSVRGPHDPDRVQHDARLGWSRIVRCYKAAGSGERANLKLELTITAAGSVAEVKPIEVEPKHGELAQCLMAAFHRLAMPVASAESVATLEIRLAPGDRAPKVGSAPKYPSLLFGVLVAPPFRA